MFYREAINEGEEVFQLPSGGSLKSLRALVSKAHPILKDVEDIILASVNETFVDEEVELKEGDVIAFFPPLSGG